MRIKFNFSPTCIGSVPYAGAEEATKRILSRFTEIPFWPQLPKRSYLENMYAQYSEGLPRVLIDEDRKNMHVDTTGDLTGEIEKVYEKYLSSDLEYFAISPEHALGFHEFLEQLKKEKPKGLKFVKGHVTGPVSFGMAVLDENKQSIFYNQELKEVLTKVLCMKVRWQIKKLKEVHPDVIIFIDEPYMVSIGSSFVNINPVDAVERINELIEEVHSSGALCGIHCCGNTDWGLLLGTDIDIINFDAYDFINSICLYPKELKKFLAGDKSIAWGIVPTTGGNKEDSSSLVKHLKKGFDTLAEKGIEKEAFLDTSLITPSCGCGTLGEAETDQVLKLALDVSEILRAGK